MILGVDIGGTNTRLLLAARDGSPLEPVRTGRFRSHDFESFPAILDAFLADANESIDAAAVGVAGPVFDGTADATNLDWDVGRGEIATRLGLPEHRVAVVNDLESTGHGIPILPTERLATLASGAAYSRGTAALIAAGTGLGMGILTRRGEGFLPLPSEGGHAELAPRGEEERELVEYLAARHGIVSWERAVAGPGLKNLFDFVVERRGATPSPEVARQLTGTDSPRIISEAGLSGECLACAAALQLFCRLYAAAAQNLALITLATGGLFIGGGIAPKILPALRSGPFVDRFRDHSTMGEVLSAIPIQVILEEDTSLLGATALAFALAADAGA